MSLVHKPALFLPFLVSVVLFFGVNTVAAANNSAGLSAPNWRHIDIAYATEHDRNSNVRADMLNLRGSLPIYEHGLVQVELNSGEVTGNANNPDMNAYQLNVLGGLRMAASEHADLYVLLGATRVEIETDAINLSEHGIISQAGVRGRVSPQLELNSYIQYSKTGGMGTTSWHGEVRYNITNRVDVLLGGGIYSRALSGKVGLSVYF